MRTNALRITHVALGVLVGGLALHGGIGLLSTPAHADDDADADKPLIAVCAIPTLINELMVSDRYRPALEETAPEIRKELNDITAELQTLRTTLEDADPNAPETATQITKFRELTSRFNTLQQEFRAALERKTAEQMSECFELVKASADAIADDLGFEYVIASGGPDEQLNRERSDITLRQITARPVVRFPKGADITDDVREDLKLD